MTTIRFLTSSDIPGMVESFARHNWHKPASTFLQYMHEQEHGTRFVWLAFYNNDFAGYITLNTQSSYAPFQDKHIPEIQDFNVLPPMRGKGIGSMLLDAAELQAAKHSPIVGLGVGLYADYGVAQRMYVKRGYIPDGLGVTYNYQRVAPGQSVVLDDDLVVWFTKVL